MDRAAWNEWIDPVNWNMWIWFCLSKKKNLIFFFYSHVEYKTKQQEKKNAIIMSTPKNITFCEIK